MWWFPLAWLACGGDEPVLPAVPDTPEEVREKRAAEELATSPRAMEARYEKPAGVYVDVRYLGGRALVAVRGEVEAQLGALVEERFLPEGQGKEMRFERGTIRVYDGAIYMIDVALDPPLRRNEALAQLGFPDSVPRDYIVLSREFRANQVWEFRRLRFFRVEEGSELVNRVQAWKRDAAD